jgi:hypothetical protein
MVSLHHELGWIISLQDVIEDLWEGKLVPLTDSSWPEKKVIGYIEHGREVLFNDEQQGIHIS